MYCISTLSKNIYRLLILSLLFDTMLYATPITNIEEAINQAGRQRMLTQKMLKEYTLIGMESSYGNAQSSLLGSIDLFENQLNKLQSYIKDKPASESLNEVKTLWGPIKTVLLKAPSKNEASKLQHDLEKLLKAAHKSTLLITELSAVSAGEIVNISGRQRMLSQRMASLYMLKVWGIDDPEFKDKLSTAMEQFDKAHQILIESPLNTKEVETLLQKVAKSYMFFDYMAKSRSKKYIPNLINKSANDILKNMNTITGIYALGKQ